MVDKVVGEELSEPMLEAKLEVMLDVMLDASGFTTENMPLWLCRQKQVESYLQIQTCVRKGI